MSHAKVKSSSLLQDAFQSWLDDVAASAPDLAKSLQNVLRCRGSYALYPPLLLLPADFMDFWSPEDSPAACVFSSGLRLLDYRESLCQHLCSKFNVTHVASNAPIPTVLSADMGSQNVMRSPLQLTPLHGKFGETTEQVRLNPSEKDLSQAFWCTVRQNAIIQIWAPLYTMFSRGNIKEKIRLLDRLRIDADQGLCDPQQSSAVDLFAGIGYFAFSYARAGFRCILCWEINPWSVEGLLRGAKANRWTTSRHSDSEPKLMVFAENNEFAADRIQVLRGSLRPIRHVNCGLLPTSRNSWKTAILCLDHILGGWLHIHENVLRTEISSKAAEIADELRAISSQEQKRAHIECEHVEIVKSYAPGVVHCVFDMLVSPMAHAS